MTICLKFFGVYLGNIGKVLGFRYFLSFADCRVHNKIQADFCFILVFTYQSAVWGNAGLPKSFGSKNTFSRKRWLGSNGPTKISWK